MTRRGFLAGIGKALAVAAMPVVSAKKWIRRQKTWPIEIEAGKMIWVRTEWDEPMNPLIERPNVFIEIGNDIWKNRT
jgi:hypothetical protein